MHPLDRAYRSALHERAKEIAWRMLGAVENDGRHAFDAALNNMAGWRQRGVATPEDAESFLACAAAAHAAGGPGALEGSSILAGALHSTASCALLHSAAVAKIAAGTEVPGMVGACDFVLEAIASRPYQPETHIPTPPPWKQPIT